MTDPISEREYNDFDDETKDEDDHQNDHFSSRAQFVVCAIGSAVGLGNVWRFPWLVFEYGGGAFFIPYAMALFLLGIPILGLEFSLAQIWQLNSIGTNHRLSRRFVGIGLFGVANSTLISTYYATIIAWTMIYQVSSFFSTLPWLTDDADRALCSTIPNEIECFGTEMPNGGNCAYNTQTNVCQPSTIGRAASYFLKTCNIGDAYNPKAFSWQLLLAFTILWGCVFLFLGFSAKIMGYIMYATMALPTLTIIVLLILGLTLDGASLGVEAYIGKWNGEILTERPEVWTTATSQIFFSLSVGSAIMMTFSSYNARDNPCGQDSVIVSICNCSYSFLAGFAVFSVAGFLANDAGVPITSLSLAGAGLAFMTYPVGAGQLAYPWGNMVCWMFFFTLFLLGLDSLVSLAEPIINLIFVSKYGAKVKRMWVTGGVCGCFWLISLIYCADYGSVLLDEVDFYVNNLGLIGLAVANCITHSWVYNADIAMKKIGTMPYMTGAILWIGGSIFGSTIAILVQPSGLWLGPVLMVSAYIMAILFPPFMANEKDEEGNSMSLSTRFYWTTIGNFEQTRHEINDITANGWSVWSMAKFTVVWTILIKYIAPGVLIFLLCNLCLRETFWIKAGIPSVMIFLGAASLFVCGLLPVAIGMVFPNLMESIVPVKQLNYANNIQQERSDQKDISDDAALKPDAPGQLEPVRQAADDV